MDVARDRRAKDIYDGQTMGRIFRVTPKPTSPPVRCWGVVDEGLVRIEAKYLAASARGGCWWTATTSARWLRW